MRKAWACSTFFASLGMASTSNQAAVPSLGMRYSTFTPFPASCARAAACMAPPDQARATQTSPLARSVTNLDELK
ncbi:hypothetical protein D9M71_810000 [compost metagenome]